MGLSTRAADYGTVPILRHIEESNREILLLVLIEDLEALDQIDAIAATEGIDVICVGPSDLGRALGVVGQPNHPELVAAIDRIAEAAKKHGKFLSLSLGHKLFPRTVAELRELGVQYVNCGPEPQVHLLRTWSEQVQGIRSQFK